MTISSNVSSSREAFADELRARELYKYFRPPAQDGESPDPMLTAHAQLVAWRLHAERAMITLIDEKIQYFVAESTKTLQLDDNHEHEHPDDAIWAGVCSLCLLKFAACSFTYSTYCSASESQKLGDSVNILSQLHRQNPAGRRVLKSSTFPKTPASTLWTL